MSKFIDKLQCVYRGLEPPMGFRRHVSEAAGPPLLMAATLTEQGAGEVKAMAGSVDAGIICVDGLSTKKFTQLNKAMGDVPVGMFLEDASQSDIVEFVDSGCDFIVFDLKTPLAAIKNKGVGRILKIEPSLDNSLVGAISRLQLQIDGVLVAGDEASLTIERLLVCQRFAELSGKPLLATLGLPVTSEELISLCEAGVNGLVLPDGLPAEAVAELRRTIEGLPKIVRRRTGGVALLPRLGGELEEEEEEEDV